MRIILFLLTVYFFYRFLRALPGLLRLLSRGAVKREGEAPRGEVHDMVPCSRCGTFVSREIAVPGSQRPYCSEKCRNETSTIPH